MVKLLAQQCSSAEQLAALLVSVSSQRVAAQHPLLLASVLLANGPLSSARRTAHALTLIAEAAVLELAPISAAPASGPEPSPAAAAAGGAPPPGASTLAPTSSSRGPGPGPGPINNNSSNTSSAIIDSATARRALPALLVDLLRLADTAQDPAATAALAAAAGVRPAGLLRSGRSGRPGPGGERHESEGWFWAAGLEDDRGCDEDDVDVDMAGGLQGDCGGAGMEAAGEGLARAAAQAAAQAAAEARAACPGALPLLCRAVGERLWRLDPGLATR